MLPPLHPGAQSLRNCRLQFGKDLIKTSKEQSFPSLGQSADAFLVVKYELTGVQDRPKDVFQTLFWTG